MGEKHQCLRHDYLLVVDFLNNDPEDLTGAQLVKQLQEEGVDVPVQYVYCATGAEVIAAIQDAIRLLPEKGNPIVHIEAHGKLRQNASSVGGIGYDINGRCEFLEWNPLWNALRTLNIATDFNLVVVIAACHGDDVIYGLVQNIQEQASALPFMASVGFEATVEPAALFEAMKNLYLRLDEGVSWPEAVVEANWSLDGSARLEFRWTGQQVAEAMASYRQLAQSGGNREYYLRHFLRDTPEASEAEIENFLKNITSFEQNPTNAANIAELYWDAWLSFDSHPGNRQRFSFLFSERT